MAGMNATVRDESGLAAKVLRQLFHVRITGTTARAEVCCAKAQ